MLAGWCGQAKIPRRPRSCNRSAAGGEDTGGKLPADQEPQEGNLSMSVACIKACSFPLIACTCHHQAVVSRLYQTCKGVHRENSGTMLCMTKRRA